MNGQIFSGVNVSTSDVRIFIVAAADPRFPQRWSIAGSCGVWVKRWR